MGKQLASQVAIDASPDRVWQVLSEFSAYPSWNPFIIRAEGPLEVGARLTLRMQPVGARPVTLRPVVLAAEEGRRLRWLGRVGVPGILDAVHDFVLEPHGDRGCPLWQREHFRGVLVPVLARSLDRHTLPAFGAMNEALKRRAEAAVTPPRG